MYLAINNYVWNYNRVIQYLEINNKYIKNNKVKGIRWTNN